ncbi:MAG: putative membrane protein [Rubritalea sp.]|jgi:uncharacterized membrane protein
MNNPINENKCYGIVFGICILAAAAIAIMPWLGEVGIASPKTAGTAGLWMNFFGEFHFIILHLPIGATVLVLSMEAIRLISFGKYKPNTTAALAFAAGAAVFAVVFGYFLYLTGEYNVDVLAEHKRDGVIFTVVIILTFLAKYSYDVKRFAWLKPAYVVALLATGGMMYSAAHKGGVIVHGDPLNALPSKVQAKRDAKVKADAVVVIDPVIYTNIVYNILENKCITCHGPDKEKGGLRLDSMAGMFEGGDEEDALVAGDIHGSYMITTISLPSDDDMHMPPESKPQVTAEELSILKWWIEMGAPENTKLSEVEVSEEITLAIATLKTPAELEEQRFQIRMAKEQNDRLFKEKREQLHATLQSVNEVFPGSLRYSSQEDTDLVFNSVSYRKSFKGSDLQLLEGVATDVVELDLSSTTMTDADIVHLEKFTNLRSLKLNETEITDEALKTIGKLENLRSLNLYGTEVTDSGVMAISTLKHIEKAYLWNTQVTPAGAENLRKSLVESMHQDEEEEKRQEPIVDLGLSSASL